MLNPSVLPLLIGLAPCIDGSCDKSHRHRIAWQRGDTVQWRSNEELTRAFRFTREETDFNGERMFLLALLAGTLVLVFWIFRSFLQPIAFATVIAIGFYPLYVRISRIVRGTNKSALLATFIVLLIFVLPVLLGASAAGGELIKAARYFGDRSTEQGGAVAYLAGKQQIALNWLSKYVDTEELHLEETMANLPG